MRYRILGPLEVQVSGRPIYIGRTKWRVLLATLLCRPNEVVSVDRLLEELWGAVLPRSARKLLQGYISQLRCVLHDPAAEALTTHKWGYQVHGYQLLVGPGEMDAQCFEELLQRGRDAFAERAYPMALALLDEALTLWRGGPLADVPPAPAVEAETSRLEELRLQASELRIEAQLHCGEATLALAELEPLVAAHPLRERLCGLLMYALYQVGRQADALTVYQNLREVLVAELSVEPGAQTQQLHQQILAACVVPLDDSGPAAAGRLGAAVTQRGPPLMQLPSPAGILTGRDEVHETLRKELARAQHGPLPLAVIDGIGGVGKSALAIEAAHRLADQFPDGHIYVDLQGSTLGQEPLPGDVVMRRLLRAVDPDAAHPPADLAEAAAQFRSLIASRRLLLVLDNAADLEQVRPLLPVGHGCAVLITSRGLLATLDGAVHLHLDVLPDHQSIELIERLVGAERVGAERNAAAAIARLCGGLPLALRIAGARLVARPGWSLRVLAERLTDTRTRLDQLQIGELTLRTVLGVDYQALMSSADPDDHTAAASFRLLGLLDESSIGVPVVAALLGKSSAVAEAALERLVDVRLAEDDGPGRYRMHDLFRLFACEQAGGQRPLKLSELTDSRATLDLMRAARACRGTACPARDPDSGGVAPGGASRTLVPRVVTMDRSGPGREN